MRNQKAIIEDIVKSIRIIEDALKGVSESELMGNIILQDAIIRRFAVIGEASKNISAELKAKHKEISWKSIVGMRDLLVHEYFDIDLDILWKAVKEDVPVLKKCMESMLKDLE